MGLVSGTRIGPYELVSMLGSGGMGEVYKAKDTRLDRTVAIKVLSDRIAGDAELRARFEREAEAYLHALRSIGTRVPADVESCGVSRLYL